MRPPKQPSTKPDPKQKNMILELKRMKDDGDTTIGILYINGIFECFIVEDQEAHVKQWGEMRILEGEYDVDLRLEGSFHARYSKKFPEFHAGMLCIHNAPDWKIIKDGITFQFVLLHIGNDDDDTAGCPLVNTSINSKTMTGSGSTDAYRQFYPKVARHLLDGGKCKIRITDIETGR